MQENPFDRVAERLVNEMYSAGTDTVNYNLILKRLPTTVKEIREDTGLTKVPVYKRLKVLEKYGLVKFEKGTGNVSSGKNTEYFMLSVSETVKKIKENMKEDIISAMISDSFK